MRNMRELERNREPITDAADDAPGLRRQPTPVSGTWALIGWLGLAIGLLWIWCQPVFGPITDPEESQVLAAVGSALIMVVAGIGAACGRRPRQATLLILGGAAILLYPVFLMFVVAGTFSIMAHN